MDAGRLTLAGLGLLTDDMADDIAIVGAARDLSCPGRVANRERRGGLVIRRAVHANRATGQTGVADATSGKASGYILRDIYHFVGMPYCAVTSGASRFMPPEKTFRLMKAISVNRT
ncbi:MAG: hypothetical protein OEM85_00135 [Gammaproteobacteria bacterium]|nr:hypothetical protein [Gammaproteobacteria bacterium]